MNHTNLPDFITSNTRLPLIAASMFLVSGPALVIACCQASSEQGIRAAQTLGADLAYMGTRFIPTNESLAEVVYQVLH